MVGFEPGFSKLPLVTVNQLLNLDYKTCTSKNHEMNNEVNWDSNPHS